MPLLQPTRRVLPTLGVTLMALALLFGCEASIANNQPQATPVLKVRVVRIYPHDRTAFTQGLEVEGETLYESTGLRGKSTLRRVDLRSGKVERYQKLREEYFGEGLTVLNNRIYQLTWEARTCGVYDKESLKYLHQFNYRGVGWGLANDGKHLLMSDGTSLIRVLDPETFGVIRELRVKDGRRSVSQLNELEYFNDHLYANIWKQDRIAKIDPESGTVIAWIDCSNVNPARTRSSEEDVLNGIAQDAESGRIFITGKKWPKLYEIEILDTSPASVPGN